MNETQLFYDSYLAHHGIKGQKWGVRRFQNKNGTLTPAGKKRYDKDNPDSAVNNDTTGIRRKQLTSEQKEKLKKAAKIGAAVVGTAVAAYGAYKLHDLYTGKSSAIDPETGFRLLKNKNIATSEHLNRINPGRIKLLSRSKNVEIIEGSSTNCMLCTTAYELRKRGFDVHAGVEKTGRGYFSHEFFPKIFKNYTDTDKIFTPLDDIGSKDKNGLMNRLTNHILDQGPGSRGNIMVWWKESGGHSMIWENVDGAVKFYDGQTGIEYKNFAKTVLRHASDSKPVEILRTDNLDINMSEIKKFINTDTMLKTYVNNGSEIAKKVAENDAVQSAAIIGATAGYSAIMIKATNASQKSMTKKGDKTDGKRRTR